MIKQNQLAYDHQRVKARHIKTQKLGRFREWEEHEVRAIPIDFLLIYSSSSTKAALSKYHSSSLCL
jgi:hypothetical protein